MFNKQNNRIFINERVESKIRMIHCRLKYRSEQLHLKLFGYCKYNFQLFLSVSHIMYKFSFLSTNVVFSNLYICQKQISDIFTFLSNKLALFFIIPHLYLLCLNIFITFAFTHLFLLSSFGCDEYFSSTRFCSCL